MGEPHQRPSQYPQDSRGPPILECAECRRLRAHLARLRPLVAAAVDWVTEAGDVYASGDVLADTVDAMTPSAQSPRLVSVGTAGT